MEADADPLQFDALEQVLDESDNGSLAFAVIETRMGLRQNAARTMAMYITQNDDEKRFSIDWGATRIALTDWHQRQERKRKAKKQVWYREYREKQKK